MKERITTAVIGLGGRGFSLLKDVILGLDDVDVVGVCDLYKDRAEAGRQAVETARGTSPLSTLDYHEILDIPGLDSIIVTTSWETHIPIAIDAMKKGIRPGVEVGGAYSIDQLWQLVHTSEETGVPCMMLENCCYGRYEMLLKNMISKGIFGELVHLEGGYRHDLREEVAFGRENRHYRNANYLNRNAENYPTHELGPIAQMLGINHGNRMLKLTSTASCSKGLNAYLLSRKGEGYDQSRARFAQGDVVTTVITCAHGETITLTLDTTLPRFYSRGLIVEGTKAMFMEDNQSFFIDGQNTEEEGFDWRKQWGNADQMLEKYEHPVWDAFIHDGVRGGHGGMDYLVDRAFFDSVKNQVDPPIDVYDMAAWMSISVLSEESIAMGSMPVAIPDFTNGRWIETRKDV
jgi:predicted dehydrogenase